jgi:glutaredoxin
VSDAVVEKIFKNYLRDNQDYIFGNHSKDVTLINTKKKHNKIVFTLKYNVENVDIKDESEYVRDMIQKNTTLGAPVFFKKINKQKIYMYLYKFGYTTTHRGVKYYNTENQITFTQWNNSIAK